MDEFENEELNRETQPTEETEVQEALNTEIPEDFGQSEEKQTEENTDFTEKYTQPESTDGAYDGGSAPQFEPFPENDSPFNRVNYSPVEPINDYKPMSRGLRVFAGVIAAVILLTAACTMGYFFGKNSVASKYTGSTVKVDLSSKPKKTDQMTAAQVYEKINDSIVGIRVYNNSGSAADASGVIYSESGYVITNDHIFSEIGAPKFRIYMADGTQYDASYVAGDSISDLAVLKIENGKKLSVPDFGNSDELFCGESVVAIGRPSDATGASSITGGLISLTKRRVKTTSNYSERLIQTDSAINPGSSGGALVNMYGQIVGITSSKLAGVEYDSIGFAIPTTTMKRVVEQLIKSGKVEDRAKLGITYTEFDSVTAKIAGKDMVGLYVATVGEDSDLFGKVSEGDVITHVDGMEIITDDVMLDVIEDKKAGDTITITVVDTKGAEKTYKAVLKANIGESSYSSKDSGSKKDSSDDSNGGGTFDFPFGE